MYEWNTLPWRTIERTVFKLQKRIYQASQTGNTDLVHKLQRLLIHSWSAKCLAVRRVALTVDPAVAWTEITVFDIRRQRQLAAADLFTPPRPVLAVRGDDDPLFTQRMPALLPHGHSSKKQMQSELHGAIGYRRPRDSAEAAIQRIRDRLGELGMIQQIEEIRAKLQPARVADGKPDVLLQREVEIVHARIPDIRKVTRRIAERFLWIARPARCGQPGRRTRPGEVERVPIEPGRRRLVEPVRQRFADQIRPVRQGVRRVAVAVRVVGDAERRSAAHRVHAGRAPAADDVARHAVVHPTLARTKRQFRDARDRQSSGDVSRADRSF